ncbi:MAG: dihydrolipoyllysine-residue acetyltransferase [Myxococcales bacterium]|nr:dihydrolipoyllysine-residue acetyltransferase [Myxococcales bacterium]
MATERAVKVPDIGEFDAVEVIEILVKPGDEVSVEQSLITLESDKATMEIPAPFAGVVKQVSVSLGDQVAEGSTIVILEVSGEAAEVEAPSLEAPQPTVAPTPAVAEAGPAQMLSQAPPLDSRPAPSALRAHATPSVRRMARELGVELSRVTGTGSKGRITKLDLEGYVKGALAKGVTPGAASGFAVPEMPEIDFTRWGEVEHEPLNKLRRISARNLHRAWLTVPHVTQFDEADITELEEFRKAKKSEAKERGVSLTPLAFFLKATAVTLQDFPNANSSLARDGESLIVKKYIHIGVAVDTDRGLVVPVIRDVDKKGLFEIAEALAVVSQKARDRKLRPDDLQGGTFSISSLGGIGGTAFTPIVNAPEVAILGIARASRKPIWDEATESFVPRLIVPLCLSYDHRVIDGADAVRFTTRLKTVLNDIRNLIL